MSNGAVFDSAAVWANANRHPAAASSAKPELISNDALCAEAPRLRRLVHRLLGWNASAHDIDDVVQDALLSAFRDRGSFRGEAKLTTWLTRIALSKAKNHARSARIRRKLLSFVGGNPDSAGPLRGAALPVAYSQLAHSQFATEQLASARTPS